MKNCYVKSLVLFILSALLLVACGGGGGGGAPANPAPENNPPADPNAFSLTALKSLTPSSMSFALTGSDTNGVNYTASLQISVLTAVAIPSLAPTAIPVRAESSLTNTDTATTATTIGTSYYAPDYTLVITTLGESPDPVTTCIPSVYNAPPDSALIGDQGDNFATLVCATINTTIYITWRLEAGDTADEAKFVITETSFVSGIEDSKEEVSYIIDKAGNVKSLIVTVTQGGVIRTLSGNKV